MATQVDLVQALDKLKSAYPNYQPDIALTLNLWKELFADIPGETLQAAILACLTEPRAFAPSAGEIRSKALELNARAAGIPDAFQAFEEVCNMPASMTRRNITEERTELGHVIVDEIALTFSHPLVETVARMIGWPTRFPTDNPGVDRGQFRQAYDAELARYMADAGRLPMLTGYIESKRPQLAGGAPMLAGTVVKRLADGKATR